MSHKVCKCPLGEHEWMNDKPASTAVDINPDTEQPFIPFPDDFIDIPEIPEEEKSDAEIKTGSATRSYHHKELSQDGISEILDIECGEPMMSQHLRIDFNPLEGVDDSEYLLNKCMDFWKLVEGSKALQHLKVLPEKNVESAVSTKSTEGESFLLQGEFPPPRLGAIEVMEDKGVIVNDCFMNPVKLRYCEGGSGDYFANLPTTVKSAVMTKWETPHKSDRSKPPTRAQREELTNLCKELDQWDLKHPKSMEPPNHGPPHTYAAMQRATFK